MSNKGKIFKREKSPAKAARSLLQDRRLSSHEKVIRCRTASRPFGQPTVGGPKAPQPHLSCSNCNSSIVSGGMRPLSTLAYLTSTLWEPRNFQKKLTFSPHCQGTWTTQTCKCVCVCVFSPQEDESFNVVLLPQRLLPKRLTFATHQLPPLAAVAVFRELGFPNERRNESRKQRYICGSRIASSSESLRLFRKSRCLLSMARFSACGRWQ